MTPEEVAAFAIRHRYRERECGGRGCSGYVEACDCGQPSVEAGPDHQFDWERHVREAAAEVES